MNEDIEHLRLLSIFHYILAGIGAVFSCFPVFHLFFGLVMLLSPGSFAEGSNRPPDGMLFLMGLLMTILPALFIAAGWGASFCIFLAGRSLAQHRRYMFCLVMAGIMCVFVPIGTVLGVFTIVVLMRPSVKELFNETAAMPSADIASP